VSFSKFKARELSRESEIRRTVAPSFYMRVNPGSLWAHSGLTLGSLVLSPAAGLTFGCVPNDAGLARNQFCM